MSDFSDFRAAVSGLMDDFGTTATYIAQIDTGEYDPATGQVSVTVGEYSVRAIMTDMTLRSNGQTVKSGTLIQEGDKLVFVEPTTELLPVLYPSGAIEADPTDDKIKVGSITYKVVSVKVVDPAATGTAPIVWELYVRR